MLAESVLKVVIVLVILFLGYQLILKYTVADNDNYVNYTLASGSPAPAGVPPTLPPVAMEGPRTIVPSGPSAPSQAAPLDTVRVTAATGAMDPYAEPNEDANAPEKLRHPERMFRPAPNMDEVNMVAESGIGGRATQVAADAAEIFAPEFAQNGGAFMGGVYANDTDLPSNFSDF